MLYDLASAIGTLLPADIVTVNTEGESVVIMTGTHEYAVTCTLTGKIRLEACNFGPVTVSTMSKGLLTVAHDVVTAIHYAG